MLPPLLAGMTVWQFAVGMLVPPLALLLVIVTIALALHCAIERWAPGPNRTPNDSP